MPCSQMRYRVIVTSPSLQGLPRNRALSSVDQPTLETSYVHFFTFRSKADWRQFVYLCGLLNCDRSGEWPLSGV